MTGASPWDGSSQEEFRPGEQARPMAEHLLLAAGNL